MTYQFTGWSDGGAATHDISTPAAATTYTANYSVVSSAGAGLQATYYDNINFTGKLLNRVDAGINFDWKAAAPVSGFGVDKFAGAAGRARSRRNTRKPTFYTQSDDRVRAWVNGRLLVNNWTDHGVTENSGTIARRLASRTPFASITPRTSPTRSSSCCGRVRRRRSRSSPRAG